jgi:uncharacterized protein YaiI (UPF0178 family)
MKIWVDADAAPRDVKEIVFRAASRTQSETILVANKRMFTPPDKALISSVTVDGGPDVADRYIAEHAEAGDIAITADIPLASILVQNDVIVIDPRGELYTAENVAERLSIRNFMESLRGSGVETGGAAPYGNREKQAFAGTLDRALAKAARTKPMEPK